jgi:hypothetical protein
MNGGKLLEIVPVKGFSKRKELHEMTSLKSEAISQIIGAGAES